MYVAVQYTIDTSCVVQNQWSLRKVAALAVCCPTIVHVGMCPGVVIHAWQAVAPMSTIGVVVRPSVNCRGG